MIELLALDGDDTLWHSESLFAVTEERFTALLAPFLEPDALRGRLLEAERTNLELFGYGVKGFTLSMVETAIEVSEGRVTASEIGQLVAWGKELLAHPVELLEGVQETLESLGRTRRLALITKGDLFHQESKIARSGLTDHFEQVEIVAEKDVATYGRVVTRLGVPPERFAMVGNSVRSDVAPVLELGGRAVHIPYHVTWAHEVLDPPVGAEDDYWQLDDIRELPRFLDDHGL